MNRNPPPERDFDEAEAYPLMEQTVLDTIAGLPDFPGFKSRMYYSPEDCEESLGEQYQGWVSLEIAYTFDGPNSESDLVRTTYTDLLRDQWTAAGYEVHQDSIDASTGRGSLEAERADGINLWWTVSGSVSFAVQTGCIPATEGFDKPDYIPPAGGVIPENDAAVQNRMNPPEDAAGEATDPFASASESPSDN
ncbi:hypothetical protein [Glycomyces harbinensis]|uniref:Uncharacterized protein n=1 Tax=Glycomyces harbinensis TaxID=58114 RepID=A0A1G7CWH7_9ACTN|nr:hypothetical protein [Glycomyces harbinensis]SDE43659.1 hypothetical protein SAMN05216270_12174 [Glycomyces harbinensis]